MNSVILQRTFGVQRNPAWVECKVAGCWNPLCDQTACDLGGDQVGRYLFAVDLRAADDFIGN